MSMRPGTLCVCALLPFLTAAALPPVRAEGEVRITSDTFGGLKARSIGPAVMSGRIAALDGVAGNPVTLYVGAASGGVWKSVNAGTTFKPIFDEHTQSIGAIKVDPSNPKTIWVGTGESWVRNSVSVGTGLYKSADGGDSWALMGLKDSERIARIAIDPKKGDTVFVCALGHLWGGNDERGVYRTTDGGKSWKQVLKVDSNTGCADLAMDPQEPRILYAAMWQARRRPDFFTSGGPGSGLYKSTDGGESWKRLATGLPAGELGRIGVAVAPSRSATVYAVVEAKKTALYRSDDAGETWTEMNSSGGVSGRPFYFAYLVVDPKDHNTVYKPGLGLAVSTDGGKSFTSPFSGGGFGGGVHSDLHALWINPDSPTEMYLGTDGGMYVSRDRAHFWHFMENLPVSQFYHVSVDMQTPYYVYGGLQDNGSWMAPSRAPGGVRNAHWRNIGFGDGFWAFADPGDPDTLYVEYQGGNMLRVNRRTGETKEIKPYAKAGEKELRFNWNTPIHLTAGNPPTLYIGSQYLLRSRDRGESWEQISPDLTTNDTARQQQEKSGGLTVDNSTAENNTTIYAISESPKNKDVIWAGTDDGYVQLTRDGGKTWDNVTAKIPGVPAGTWVSRVEASPHAEGRCYVTFDGHRQGDMKPYAFRTDDFGQTWKSVITPDIEGFVFILRDDLVNPNLLFMGTEFGLWLSLDAGAQWARFSGGLPKVAVHDIAIHPREGDLVLATHGRGIYILDDLAPIRALTQQILDQEAALLAARPAQMQIQAGTQDFIGDAEFVGANPSEVATITYWLKKRHLFGDLKVEVIDADGKVITTIPGTKRVGINRVEWPMRLPAPKVPRAANLVPAFEGPRVAEGTYKVRLIKAKDTINGEVTLVGDPRSPHTAADRAQQQRTAMQIYRDLERLTWVAEQAGAARDGARKRAEPLKPKESLRTSLEGFAAKLDEFGKSLAATSEGGGITGEQKLRERMGSLYGAINGYDGKPTESQLARLSNLQEELEAAVTRWQELSGKDLPGLNTQLSKRSLEPIVPLDFEAWRLKQQEEKK